MLVEPLQLKIIQKGKRFGSRPDGYFSIIDYRLDLVATYSVSAVSVIHGLPRRSLPPKLEN
jgi:hypothetical protein